MSVVKAYRCDCCHLIKDEKRIVGVSGVEDMFETMKSYPTIMNPEKTHVHYCLDCYSSHVIQPAQMLVNRKRDEESYKAKLHELSYNLRKQCVFNWKHGKGKED